MSQPKVSVLIPVYNTEQYLRGCLDSVISQTLTDLEIICVNDGSTDHSGDILQEYAGRDRRIQIIEKPNGGYGSAMNIGLQHVTGQYIGIVEPDDAVKPDMYQTLYGLAEQHQADIAKSNFINFFDASVTDAKGNPIKPHANQWFTGNRKKPKSTFSIREHPEFLSFHPSIWSCIYRTAFIREHNIDFQEIPGAGWADNLFQVKTMVKAGRVTYTDQALYCYRRRHLDDAEDLKDITLPFRRTGEIREWLEKQDIQDKGIQANLTKRELNYIQLVFRSIKEDQLQEVEHYIQRYIERIDLSTLMESPDCTSQHRRMMKWIQEDITGYYRYYKKKREPSIWKEMETVRKKLFRVNLKKEEKEIIFCGIKIV